MTLHWHWHCYLLCRVNEMFAEVQKAAKKPSKVVSPTRQKNADVAPAVCQSTFLDFCIE